MTLPFSCTLLLFHRSLPFDFSLLTCVFCAIVGESLCTLITRSFRIGFNMILMLNLSLLVGPVWGFHECISTLGTTLFPFPFSESFDNISLILGFCCLLRSETVGFWEDDGIISLVAYSLFLFLRYAFFASWIGLEAWPSSHCFPFFMLLVTHFVDEGWHVRLVWLFGVSFSSPGVFFLPLYDYGVSILNSSQNTKWPKVWFTKIYLLN